MRYKWAGKQLLFIIFAILFLYFVIGLIFYQIFQAEDEVFEYFDDFDREKDEIFVKEYLKLMQRKQAYIRPVVEKEFRVQEDYWCFLEPVYVSEESQKWTKMAGIEVFSAYYDDRPNSLFPQNSDIQVLVMSNHTIEGKIKFFCNIRVENGSFGVVRGYIREIWQKGWDPRDTMQTPSLITCPIPKRIDNPEYSFSISLTRKPCVNSRKYKKVIGKSKNKKNPVAVCVKGLDYQEDISGRLLEWIEMQYLFGADKISIYSYFLTPKTRKVLEYYSKTKGSAAFEVTPLELPGTDPNDPVERNKFLKENRPQKRRHELIPYNDCFLRHIHTHKYVLIIDIDEVIVPTGFDNYADLLDGLEKRQLNASRPIGSVSARNVFKFTSNFTIFPSYYHMVSNRKRSKKTSQIGEYGKSFSSTASVATVFNHFALHKLSKYVGRNQHFLTSEAIKLHYKSECPWESRNECHQLQYELEDDTSLDKYEKELRLRVDKAVKNIGVF